MQEQEVVIIPYHGADAFLRVDYTEFKPETYQGVVVSIDGKPDKTFNSGSFDEDYEAAGEYAKSKADKVFNLSSVDDFISDLKKIAV